MSEPKRYERCYHKDYIPEGMEEHYNGKWVSWEDYARLKAEVERLTERNKYLEQIDSYLQDGINMANEEHCIQLEAQVERLTKAGDDMAFHYHQLELRVGNYSFSVKAPSIQAWEKAKEVQS